MHSVKKWVKTQVVDSKNFGIFIVESIRKKLPLTTIEHDFVHIATSDWVSIIALTSKNKLVMIQQYRHGADSVQIDLPGGAVDMNERPADSARRELEEETGFTAKKMTLLGCLNPNPAIFQNKYYVFLALNATRIASQKLDATEDIIVKLLPKDSIPGLIKSGVLQHSLVVAAFYLYDHYAEDRS